MSGLTYFPSFSNSSVKEKNHEGEHLCESKFKSFKLFEANMYIVSILDTGDNSENEITKVREVVISCLEQDPESTQNLEEKLASQLRMTMRCDHRWVEVWVGQLGRNYIIHIWTMFWDKEKIVFRAKRNMELSLQDTCLDAIINRLNSGANEKDINGLGLPQCLEENLLEKIKSRRKCLDQIFKN